MDTKQAKIANKHLAFTTGKMFAVARKAAKLSQKALAKKMHTGQNAITRLESGKHLPSLAFVQRAANALGMAVNLSLLVQPFMRLSRDADCPNCGFNGTITVAYWIKNKPVPVYLQCGIRCGWVAPLCKR